MQQEGGCADAESGAQDHLYKDAAGHDSVLGAAVAQYICGGERRVAIFVARSTAVDDGIDNAAQFGFFGIHRENVEIKKMREMKRRERA